MFRTKKIYIYLEIKMKSDKSLQNLRQNMEYLSALDVLMEHIYQYLPHQKTLKTTFVIKNFIL